MDTRDAVTAALAEQLATFDVVVEVGVGERPAVAAAVASRGTAVTATDVTPREVPDGVAFVVDDVTSPDVSVYEGAGVVYALNCPPELQRPLVDVARAVGATAAFTTLGADSVVVPAEPEALPGTREILYVASPRGTR